MTCGYARSWVDFCLGGTVQRKLALSLAALLGLIGLTVPVAQVTTAAPAQAAFLDILSCSSAQLDGVFTPELEALSLGDVHGEGSGDFGTCTDLNSTGITDGSITAAGDSLALCVPAINPIQDVVLGLAATGTVTITWVGGTGPATTTFNWIIAGAFSIGITSVVQITGTSTGGRFHDNGVAVFTAQLQLDDLDPSCLNGISSWDAHTNMFVMADTI